MVSLLIIGGVAGFYFLYKSFGSSVSEAPDYQLETLSGGQFSLSSIRPNVTLLDFMSVTCTPCKEMNPIIQALTLDPDLGNITFISLEIDPLTTKQQLEEYIAKYNITWTVVFAPDGMMNDFNVESLPTFVIINSEGKITFHEEGLISKQDLKTSLIKTINNELGETSIVSHSGFVIGMAIITAIASFFSPCAFPLMPSYLAHILGQDTKSKKGEEEAKEEEIQGDEREEDIQTKKKENNVLLYILIGSFGGVGILVSYLLLGFIITILGSAIKTYIPYLVPIIGGILILLGITMFTNFSLQFSRIQQWINKKQLRFNKGKDSATTRIQQTFLYGIGYGLASLGCNAPIFFAFALQVSSQDIWKILFAFIAFSLTIIILMATATVLISFSRDVILNNIKSSTDIIKKIAAAIIVAVGIYLLLEFFLHG
ncbi:MAG: thioredoxin-like domain-containing protein [Candidatus Heimdallarchaeaceae archaeon]